MTLSSFLTACLLAYTLVFASGERVDDEEVVNFPGNLVELGDSNPIFSTLLALVRSVGLDEALSGDGPFTLFAPTNDAFDALSPDVLEYLASNEESLTSVLLYHVVGGEALLKSDLENGPLETLEGGNVDISNADTCCPNVNQAKFVFVNGITTNGVAHGIDSVLIPPSILEPACSDICCCDCCGECTGEELGFAGCVCKCSDYE